MFYVYISKINGYLYKESLLLLEAYCGLFGENSQISGNWLFGTISPFEEFEGIGGWLTGRGFLVEWWWVLGWT